MNLIRGFCYQLDFITPGSLPSDASVRKQIRQIPNFLINALGLPHMGHRLYALTLNFGVLLAFIRSAVFAKRSSLFVLPIDWTKPFYLVSVISLIFK